MDIKEDYEIWAIYKLAYKLFDEKKKLVAKASVNEDLT